MATTPATVSETSPFLTKVQAGTAVVGIIGLGYVGLPLARGLRRRRLPRPRLRRRPGQGREAPPRRELHRPHRRRRRSARCATSGSRRPTDFDRLGEAGRHHHLRADAADRGPRAGPDATSSTPPRPSPRTLRRGQLVVLESTTYPGTTRDVVLPILEATGLKAGEDFFLAFSPEREDPGNANFSTTTIPKVVGGLEPRSLELAVRPVPAGDRQRRAGLDAGGGRGVQDPGEHLPGRQHRPGERAEDPLRPHGHRRLGGDRGGQDQAVRLPGVLPRPGPGRALHPDRPVLPDWVARKYGLNTRFIELAGEVNTAMPAYVVAKVADALNDAGKPVKGSKITLLGMAYKKDVDDPRESPGFELMDLLLQEGRGGQLQRPAHPDAAADAALAAPAPMTSQPLTPEYLASQDCVLIATDHSAYDYTWIVAHSRLVVDTRNATKNVTAGREKIVKA